MLINLKTKQSITEYAFRRQHSTTAFPKELTNDILQDFDHAVLTITSRPNYDSWEYKLIESAEEKNGTWIQTWTLQKIEHTDEEIQEKLELEKERLISIIDAETSKKISSGFFCNATPPDTNEEESLFFSYDSFDQQNFADAAITILNYVQSGMKDELKQSWNAYRNHTDDYKGDLIVLELSPATFLPVYQAACMHKATIMTEGSVIKEKVRNALTLEELKDISVK